MPMLAAENKSQRWFWLKWLSKILTITANILYYILQHYTFILTR